MLKYFRGSLPIPVFRGQRESRIISYLGSQFSQNLSLHWFMVHELMRILRLLSRTIVFRLALNFLILLLLSAFS